MNILSNLHVQLSSRASFPAVVSAAFFSLGLNMLTVNAAELARTSIGCKSQDTMHELTRLAASGEITELQGFEDQQIKNGKCIRLATGTSIDLVSSVRAHVPGTHILYSLALVTFEDRQFFIHRNNLAP